MEIINPNNKSKEKKHVSIKKKLMFDIKLNTIGKIIKGDNPGWYLQIKYDSEETGGYYIFQFKFKNEINGMGDAFDDWVENLQDVESYFSSSEWKVEWQV